MNWYKIAQNFSKNTLYRGDPTFIPFEQMNTLSQFDHTQKESLVAFANTPGLYFTNSKENALHYGKYLTEVEIKNGANILDTKSLIDKLTIEKIIMNNPDINNVALNWDENEKIGIKMIINSIVLETDPIERLKAIWAEAFPNSNSEFVNAMVNCGFDGVRVYKEGYEHYVIYNKNCLNLIKQEQI